LAKVRDARPLFQCIPKNIVKTGAWRRLDQVGARALPEGDTGKAQTHPVEHMFWIRCAKKTRHAYPSPGRDEYPVYSMPHAGGAFMGINRLPHKNKKGIGTVKEGQAPIYKTNRCLSPFTEPVPFLRILSNNKKTAVETPRFFS